MQERTDVYKRQVLAVLAGGYAVYDIRTDTGWFAGLLGALIMFMGCLLYTSYR